MPSRGGWPQTGREPVVAWREAAGSARMEGVIFLAQLRFLVEERPQGVRRTVFLTGDTTGRQALELAGGEAVRLDSRVTQVVTDAGHLVLIAGTGPLDSPEAGLMQLVVSTYGLAEEGFAEVLGRWTAQWPPVARNAEITIAPAS